MLRLLRALPDPVVDSVAVPATHRHPEHLGQPGAGPASQRQPDRFEQTALHRTPARMRRGQPAHLFGERAPNTARAITEGPTHPQPDQRRHAADRGVVQAVRAGGAAGRRTAADHDPIPPALDHFHVSHLGATQTQ
jgi:hypothetical protein